MTLSIIIPAFHEADTINALLESLMAMRPGVDLECIVADGAPEQDTLRAITVTGVRKVASEKGRAVQMNTGAQHAKGNVLLFLHADTRITAAGVRAAFDALTRNTAKAGAFTLRIETTSSIVRCINWCANLRTHWTRVPYGDQAIFIDREYFNTIGAYADMPLMEDLELMHRIKQRGDAIHILKEPAITSARRWEKEGALRCLARNLYIRLLYHLGVGPEKLAKWYQSD